MKNKASFIVDLLICVLLISGLFFCLASSFDIKINPAVLVISTAMFCTVYALLATLVQRGGKLALCTAVTMIVFIFSLLFSLDIVLSQTSYAVTKALSQYSLYLPVADKISLGTQTSGDATVLFVFMSALYSAAFALSLIRAKRIFVIVLTSVLTLIPCFILVDTLPEIFWLITTVSLLFALYATKLMLRYNPAQSGGAAAGATAVICIMLAVILALNPIDGYRRFEWQDNMLNKMQSFFNYGTEAENELGYKLNSLGDDLSDDNLAELSPIEQEHKKVMSVLGGKSGNIYLKGVSYADFSDNTWHILSRRESADYPEDFNAFCLTDGREDVPATEIKISTTNREKLIYTPYFLSDTPSGAQMLGDVCLSNGKGLLQYTLPYCGYAQNYYENGSYYANAEESDLEGYRSFVYDTYLQIPDKTRTELFKIAVNNGLTLVEKEDLPNEIKRFVSSSADYSLETPQMPQGKDFAPWFLNECDTGYCVHFATAATLMLRTLGIPARYVTGYYANAENNKWTDVTSDNSHAWVEFFDDGAGWIPLECTPSSFAPSDGEINSAQTDPEPLTTAAPQTTVQPTTADASAGVTVPTAGIGGKSGPEKIDGGINYNLLLVLIFICALAAFISGVLLRRYVIVKSRKKHFTSGSNRIRVIHYYRYLLLLQKYSRILTPDEILNICEKAKFSRHSIDDDEIALVAKFTDNSVKEFCANLSLIKKAYYRFIVALF